MAPGSPHPIDGQAPERLLMDVCPGDPPQGLESHLKVPDGKGGGGLHSSNGSTIEIGKGTF